MPESGENKKETVTFHLIKAPDFQSKRVDGAFGSVAPNGLSLSFFVERPVIPKTMTHEITADDTLGKLVDATGKEGLVREIITGILLDVDAAKTLAQQLDTMVSAWEKQQDDDES